MEAQEASRKNDLSASLLALSLTDVSAPGQSSEAVEASPADADARTIPLEKMDASLRSAEEQESQAQITTTGAGDGLLQAEKQEKLTLVDEEKGLLIAAEHEVTLIVDEGRKVVEEAERHMAIKVAIEDAATFGEFWLKFLNDWTFNFASGLAYHLLMAMLPIAIAVAAIVGFIEGDLSHTAQQGLITAMSTIFPSVLGPDILAPALVLLRKDAGFLGIIAIVLALYSGSRLFSCMEDCFAIIYHTPTRSFWGQNAMALVMLLAFILLIPVMLLASSIGMGGLVGGLVASLILFQAIYMIVPNQKISWRKSWRGTLVAAVALQIYIALFPLYIRHFLGSYTGNTGFAIILLLFFYYFALILLIGAEVNAFYAEGVRAKPRNIAEIVHEATLATDKAELLKLALARMQKQRKKK